tara:strand:+ start:4768 stop:5499 length:732 start_codon:yes stop_codon:yes gene_type:complete
MKYVLILGATSDIAKSLAEIYASKGINLYLAARNLSKLENFIVDLSSKFSVKIIQLYFDALEYDSHQKFYENLKFKPVGVISAIGLLGNQNFSEENFDSAKNIIDTNFIGIVSIINIIVSDFEKRKEGFIICISSVAGDRGRSSNYFYGSAKSALNSYLSGIRNRLHFSKVSVLTVKPGFVNTSMTKNLNLPKIITSSPKKVARDIYHAQKKGRNIIYTSWYWKWIMLIINSIPEFIFKKLKL